MFINSFNAFISKKYVRNYVRTYVVTYVWPTKHSPLNSSMIIIHAMVICT